MLITLAIIGVVAALTMPVLINKYQERVTITKVKKMYSVLNQAVKLAEVDNGPVNTWNLPKYFSGGSQELYSYLKPYLRVAKECVEDNSGNCLDTNTDYYYLNGMEWGSPNSESGYGNKYYVRLILSDGSLIWFRSAGTEGCTDTDSGYTDVCGLLWYDVNGSAKPNTMAKDIFAYFLRPSGVYPYAAQNCYLNRRGWGCSKWILEHDNMNYPETAPSESSENQ